MTEVSRWIVIIFGFGWAAWFALLAITVEREKNGDMIRVPILWALAWLGLVVAAARIIIPTVPTSIHNSLNRLFIITGMIPLGLVVTRTMRRYLPKMKQTVWWWRDG